MEISLINVINKLFHNILVNIQIYLDLSDQNVFRFQIEDCETELVNGNLNRFLSIRT